MKKQKSKTFMVTMTGVCLLLGFMMTIQISTLSSTKAKGGASDYLNLMTQVSQQQRTNALLSQKVAKAKAQLLQYQASGSNWKSKRAALLKDAQQVKAAAGLTAKSGAGITITLEANPNTPNASQKQPFQAQLILSYIVNLLYSQGAQAISIGGDNGATTQRLITTSTIRQIAQTNSGNATKVVVNYTPLIAPYTITAIGDTSRMKAILIAENVVQLLQNTYGEACYIQTSSHLTVPAYQGEMPGKYAKEVTGQ